VHRACASHGDLVTAAFEPITSGGCPGSRVAGRSAETIRDCCLLAANHDSYWDPVAVGVAQLERRQVRALAKSSMWKVKGLNRILDGMGQIPIERGAADAGALDRAIEELRAGACIGVFPEGTRSLGRELRARSGLGRLAAAVPEAAVVCCSIQGTTDIPRFPKRPHVRLRFFLPAQGGLRAGEAPPDFVVRLLEELRAGAPRIRAGRRPAAAPAEPHV
jgi:1-acyl-sn-glycerol-3-phosphate acyltransferase